MTAPDVFSHYGTLLSEHEDRQLIEETVRSCYVEGKTFGEAVAEVAWENVCFDDGDFRQIYDFAADCWTLLAHHEPRTTKWSKTHMEFAELLVEAGFTMRAIAFELARTPEAVKSQAKRHGWAVAEQNNATAERRLLISYLFFGYHDEKTECQLLKAERKGDQILTRLSGQRGQDADTRRSKMLDSLGLAGQNRRKHREKSMHLKE